MSKGAAKRLENRVVIVTGGAYGIGRAFCRRMAEEGASVVIADIDIDAAETTAGELRSGNFPALAVKTDVSDEESTLSMAEKAAASFGRIDILVNNAAVYSRFKVSQLPFNELPVGDWDRMMAVNLKGPFLCSRAVFPYMKRQAKGKIINISSATFFEGLGTITHYVTSKAGIIGLTRSLASAVAQYNINVNCIAPGRTLSEDPSDAEAVAENEQRASVRGFKRIERPEDLTGTVVFLASDDSDFITGQTIVVDGGTVFN